MNKPSEENDKIIVEFVRSLFRNTRAELPVNYSAKLHEDEHEHLITPQFFIEAAAIEFCEAMGMVDGYALLRVPNDPFAGRGPVALVRLRKLLRYLYEQLGSWGTVDVDNRACVAVEDDISAYIRAYVFKRKLNALLD